MSDEPESAQSTAGIPVVEVVRAFDARVLNTVANHPAVYPWVRGGAEGTLDLTSVVEDTRNVLLEGRFGSMLFLPMAPGLWELHTQVLPEGRGAWTLGLAAACSHWMFTRTDAVEILTRVPQGNVPAGAAVRRCGFSLSWTSADGWVFEGKPVSTGVWSLTIQRWLSGEFATGLEEGAAAFFAVTPAPPAPVDSLRPFGFALAAIRGKQPAKGCVFLNRWGAIAGAAPAFVASLDPLVVSFGGAKFRFDTDGIPIKAETEH